MTGRPDALDDEQPDGEAAQRCTQCQCYRRPGLSAGYCTNGTRADLAPGVRETLRQPLYAD